MTKFNAKFAELNGSKKGYRTLTRTATRHADGTATVGMYGRAHLLVAAPAGLGAEWLLHGPADGTAATPAPVKPLPAPTPAALATLSAAIIREAAGIYCGLSPENLSCDGEASRSWVRRQRSKLLADLRRLEKKAGRPISESEAFGSKPYEGERSATQPSAYASEALAKWSKGDRVRFTGRRGAVVVGTVMRVNTKTVSVKPDGERGSRYWRVGPSLLKAA